MSYKMNFLIDSGAEISIVRLSSIAHDTNIQRNEQVQLIGLLPSTKQLRSIGTCIMHIQLNGESLSHKFHVVNDDQLTLRQDAILGVDFLKTNELTIDYSNKSIPLTRNFTSHNTEVNILSEIQKIVINQTDLYLNYILLPILTQIAIQKNIRESDESIYCKCFGCNFLRVLKTNNVEHRLQCAKIPLNWLLSQITYLDIKELTHRIPQLLQSMLTSSTCICYGDLFHLSATSLNGSIISEMSCSNCNLFIQDTTEFIQIRCLPLPTVQASISTFFSKQLVELSNYQCSSCSWKYTCCIQHWLTIEPKFLYLSIQRNRTFQESETHIKNVDIQKTIYLNKRGIADNKFPTLKYELVSISIFQNTDKINDIDITLENRNIHTANFKLKIIFNKSHYADDILCNLLYELKQPNDCSNQIDNNNEKTFDQFLDQNEINTFVDEFLHPNNNIFPYMNIEEYTHSDNENENSTSDLSDISEFILTENLINKSEFENYKSYPNHIDSNLQTKINFNEDILITDLLPEKCDLDGESIYDIYTLLKNQNREYTDPTTNKNLHTKSENIDLVNNHKFKGLFNPNHMCFANALYQAILFDLFHNLNKYLQTILIPKAPCTCIGCVLRKTTKIYMEVESNFHPYLFHNWVNMNRTAVYNDIGHEDVHELLKNIMLELSNNNNICKVNFFEILRNFMGILSIQTVCSQCNHSNKIREEFSELILKPTTSISDAIKNYFTIETIDNYVCNTCQHTNTTHKEIQIDNLPRILCILLNRSDHLGKKNVNSTTISSMLDMAKYLSSDHISYYSTYTLKSFICHEGPQSNQGHYYTVRTVENNAYIKLNDIQITHLSKLIDHSEKVYLLFYELTNDKSKQVASIETSQQEHDLKLTRFKQISEKIKTNNTDPEVNRQINELLFENTDVFHLKGDKLTCCDILEHTIPLFTDSKPVNVRPYSRRSKFENEELEKKVQELVELGIVEPCRSPYNSPLHLVKKGLDDQGKPNFCLVVDYRMLNAQTIAETYPVTQVIDILDHLGQGSKYYSSLDLRSGFLQIKLKESCRDKTAFSSGYNHFRWKRMPLGLRSSSHTFNRVIRIALADLIGKILYVYLDDIIVISNTIPEHLERLQTVFSTLRKHNLKLSPSKCNLLKTELRFLGFIVSEKGVLPDKMKTDAITNLPQPKNPKAVKSFMGMVNYYSRHIPKLAEHAKPLHTLLKKETKFHWSKECQEAFDYFKQCLTTPPILQFPDFNKIFYITCDASKTAISAILCQKDSKELLPICYASRTLLDAETRYSGPETEVLAIVWGVRHYKTYINNQFFEVFSDCQALQWLLQLKSPNSRLTRWKFELAGYDFKITHIKGKDNHTADCLSRYISAPEEKSINALTRAQKLKQQTPADYKTPKQTIENITECKTKTVDIHELPTVIESMDEKLINDFPNELFISNTSDSKFLFDKQIDSKLILPWTVIHKAKSTEFILLTTGFSIDPKSFDQTTEKLKNILIKTKVTKLHFVRNTFSGNSEEYEFIKSSILKQFTGTNIHFLFLKAKITILNDQEEIQQILEDFHDSPLAGHQGVRRMANKISQQYKWFGLRKDVQNYVRNCKTCQLTKPMGLSKQPMQITSTSRSAFSKICIDNIGPLPDNAQGFKYIFTFQDDLTRYFGAVPIIDHTADTVARTLVEHVILRFGLPEVILSDLGVEFENLLFPRVMKLLGIKHYKTSGYHPQTNGMLERSHATLKAILRSRTNNFVANWPEFVPYATFVINSSINRSTNYQPHLLVFGYKLELPSNLKRRPEPLYNYDDFLTELKFKLQSAHYLAREEILKNKMINKEAYDKKAKTKTYEVGDKILLTNENRETKLHNPFTGPYKITEIISDVNVKIDKNNKSKIVHINRTKKFHENTNEQSLTSP